MRAPVDRTCESCGKTAEARFGVPLLKTATAFMAGAKYGAEQFAGDNAITREQYLAPARKAGVSINGKVYQHGLARFIGDPQAWVSSPDDVRKRAIEMGGECEHFKIKAQEQPPKEDIVIGEDIVQNKLDQMVEAGTITTKQAKSAEKRFEVADTLAPPDKKGKYRPPRKNKT